MKHLIIVVVLAAVTSAWGFDEPHKYNAQWTNGMSTDSTYFPIAAWGQGAHNINNYKAMGINLYVNGSFGLAGVLQCKIYGMPVITHQTAELLARPDITDGAVVAWMHSDEPDNAQSNPSPPPTYIDCVNPSVLMTDYNAWKAADPTRPTYLNLGQGVSYIEYIGRGSACSSAWEMYIDYLAATDIGCYDIYPSNSSYSAVRDNLWYVPKGVDSLRSWSNDLKPVWAWIECTDISDGGGSKPTIGEVKTEIWMALIHGANGYGFFCHSFVTGFTAEAAVLNDTYMKQAITGYNERVTSLAAVLNSPTVSGRVTCSAANVDIMVKEFNGDLFIFAVEMTNVSASPTFSVTSPPENSVTVLDEDRSVTISGGNFSDSFDAYEVHLYHVGSNFTRIEDIDPLNINGTADISVTRNPFRSTTELVVRNTRNELVTGLDIYTADGKLVSILPVRSGKAVWDGTDANGAGVPAGVYLAGINGRVTARIMKTGK